MTPGVMQTHWPWTLVQRARWIGMPYFSAQ
jgi:hypothetical protein